MKKNRILVIDDDESIIALIVNLLGKEYDVIVSSTGEEGIAKAQGTNPDLILLDLVMPDMGGLDVCRVLRQEAKTKRIPIIILTAFAVNPEDKVAGLETGADDYLTKPFYKGELIARINAVLRRSARKEGEKIIEEGDILLDRKRHTVSIKGRPLELAPKEFDLLYFLLKRKGIVLSRKFLAETIWGYEYTKSTRTIDMTMAHLREKLGPYGKKIVTVEKSGYKFLP